MAKHKDDSHFIPSPFGVVTSYENAFIKEFNRNLSGAVSEVLKYIAKTTASDIKDAKENTDKAFEEDLEKARKVGEIHPSHPDWVWTEYSPGKFDWRSNKGKHYKGKTAAGSNIVKKEVNVWDSVPDIEKAKTVNDCLKVLYDADMINPGSTLSGCNLKTAKRVCNVIYNVHNIFHMDKISVITKKSLGNATAQANGGNSIELNLQIFKAFDSSRYHKSIAEDYVKNLTYNLDRLVEKEKQLKESGNYDPIRGKQLSDKIRLAKEKLDKFPCWTMGGKDTCCEDIVIHELGHILNSQCTGGCGIMDVWERLKMRSDEYLQKSKELNKEHKDIFLNKYVKEKRFVSEYSSTKRAECFAECFVAYVHKDKNLPDYMNSFFDKYFKTTNPKNLMYALWKK